MGALCAVPLLVVGGLVLVITVLGEPASEQFTDVGQPVAAPVGGAPDGALLDGELLAWTTVGLAGEIQLDLPVPPDPSEVPVDGFSSGDTTIVVEHPRFRVAVAAGAPGEVGVPVAAIGQLSDQEWQVIAAEQGLVDPALGTQRVVASEQLDVELLGTIDGVPSITHLHRSVVDGVAREIAVTGPLLLDEQLRAINLRVQESIVDFG